MTGIVVLGAAGKMGSGIALSILQDIAGSNDHQMLTLLEVDFNRFDGLKRYLRDQLKKYAERSINQLRARYSDRSDLIDNSEMIDAYIIETMDKIRFVTSPQECVGAKYIFEAIAEDVAIKTELFKQVAAYGSPDAYFLTNTSSIPISELATKANLIGRMIGFHFYNPPAIQKLLEVIIPKGCDPHLQKYALDLAKKLGKTVVISNDIAGFIGNGHFIREVIGSCKKVRELQPNLTPIEALYAINWVTQDLLLRPMGIFQLVDYVGIDVCHRIGLIMTTYLRSEAFTDQLLEMMLDQGVSGGQNPDGSQKDGFFHYEKGKPQSIYDLSTHSYVPLPKLNDDFILPESYLSWKELSKDLNHQTKIYDYLLRLKENNSLGCKLAQSILHESEAIASNLVKDHVAHSLLDVHTVLKNGFFHLF